MTSNLVDKLTKLASDPAHKSAVAKKLLGLEKESLRYFHNGQLANTKHPLSLGDTLTHPCITTDYAESQLELITSPYHTIDETLSELHEVHSFIYEKISDKQLLWPLSIPGDLPRAKDIMVAQFGKSLRGQLKELYRRGLAYRYGKIMQLICGIHYNFSFSNKFWGIYFNHLLDKPNWNQSDVNSVYMNTIRNYMRISWLTTYLFGSSPLMNSSFITKDMATANYLKLFKDKAYIADYGTSLRESNLGYHNKANVQTLIDYNSLTGYADSLYHAVNTQDDDFTKLGLYRSNKQIQLNCNILQIENEYYGLIRPKPDIKNALSPPYKNLLEQGIFYIELRNIDINPLEPIGISKQQCQFLETILYYCLLSESQPFKIKDRIEILKNVDHVALLGRQENSELSRNGEKLPTKLWADEIFKDLKVIAKFLDTSYELKETNEDSYSHAIGHYQQYIQDPSLCPSALLVNSIREQNKDYTDIAQDIANNNLDYFKNNKLSPERRKYYEELAKESINIKREEELDDIRNNIDLTQYLEEYYSN